MFWVENERHNIISRSMHEGLGEIKTRPFFDDVSHLPVKFQVWELDPGVSEGRHSHEGIDSLEELYYFIQGQGEMWFNKKTVPVSAGQAVLVPEGIDHGFRNTGTIPLRLVIIWGKPKA